MTRIVALFPCLLLLAACGGKPPRPTTAPVPAEVAPAVRSAPAATEARPDVQTPRGGFYLDDGPPAVITVDLAAVPDAVPRDEPLHRFANRPYNVFGQNYVPLTVRAPFRQEGVASWYGRRYHGQKTSSGEIYDMFAMTAAHPTLPIPSYARVTRIDGGPESGKTVVVRINDRGPFLHGRIIDLSYTAAWRLGILDSGSGRVVVESVFPGGDTPPAPIQVAAAGTAPGVLRDIEEQGGHYLQLGAFGNRENAEALRATLAARLDGLGERLVIRSAGRLHRLQLGPWSDAAEARRVAEQLRLVFDLPSVLVK